MEIPGDLMIGGVFNVHASDENSPFQCGNINVEEGFQYTEAFRYAIDMINKVVEILLLKFKIRLYSR